jgi:hypothetical protein
MTERGIRQAMQALRFCEDWQTLGWLDIEELDSLYAEYHRGDDKNTEHYRYKMFRKGIAKRIPLTNDHIEQCLSLAEKEPDKVMISSVMELLFHRMSPSQKETYHPSIYLLAPHIQKREEEERLYQNIRQGHMTEELFQEYLTLRKKWIFQRMAESVPLPYLERLDTHLEGKDPYVRRELQRRQFYQRWEREGFSEALLDFALESNHGEIQRFLVDREVLSTERLRVFADKGATHKVRRSARGQIKHWENIEKKFASHVGEKIARENIANTEI